MAQPELTFARGFRRVHLPAAPARFSLRWRGRRPYEKAGTWIQDAPHEVSSKSSKYSLLYLESVPPSLSEKFVTLQLARCQLCVFTIVRTATQIRAREVFTMNPTFNP